MTIDKAISIREAAKALNVSKETIRRKLKTLPSDLYYSVRQGQNTIIYITPEGFEVLRNTDPSGAYVVTDTTAQPKQSGNEAATQDIPAEQQGSGASGADHHTDTRADKPHATPPQCNEPTHPLFDTLTVMQNTIDLLTKQIEVKDTQIAERDRMIASLTEALNTAHKVTTEQQKLTMAAYAQLPIPEEIPHDDIPLKRRTFWEWLTGK